MEEEEEIEQLPSKAKKKSSWLACLGDDSLSSPSPSDREEGELSVVQGQGLDTFRKVDCLCPGKLYPRVLLKSAKKIDLNMSLTPPQVTAPSRAKTYSQGPPKPQVVL